MEKLYEKLTSERFLAIMTNKAAFVVVQAKDFNIFVLDDLLASTAGWREFLVIIVFAEKLILHFEILLTSKTSFAYRTAKTVRMVVAFFTQSNIFGCDIL